jgi:hypothetical protein
MKNGLVSFRIVCVVVLTTLFVGCSGGDPEDTADHCTDAEATLAIGDGEYTWAPLSAGQEVVMVHGPQGGWHVLASIWTENIATLVTIDYVITATDFEGYVVADDSYRVAMVTDDDCGGFYPGIYGYLEVEELASGEVDTPPEVLAYSNLRLSMTVTDSDGRVATDMLAVVASPDPMDVVDDDTGEADADG